MALGTFKAPQAGFIPATKFDAAANAGRPLIVIVREYKEDFSTDAYPNPRPVVFVMIAELSGAINGGEATPYVNALLGGQAVADRLKAYAGAQDDDGNPVKLPVKLGKAVSKRTGRAYQTIEPLSGTELDFAEAWDAANPTFLQDERARLQAIADAEAEQDKAPAASNAKAAGNGAGTGFDDDALKAAMARLRS